MKNQTGEGHHYYWGQPYELPQWQVQQGWAPPPPNWIQPPGGVPPSQGWALPPGGIPMPGWISSSIQPARPLWTLFDDSKFKFLNLKNLEQSFIQSIIYSCNSLRVKKIEIIPIFLFLIMTKNLGNMCTLDASILVVLENGEPIASSGLNVNPQPQSPYYGGDFSSNAVRMACSHIATTSTQACSSCCKMACKHYGISTVCFYPFFIINKIEHGN